MKLPSEFPDHALLLGHSFQCVDDAFSEAQHAYPKLPRRGESYRLIELHWGRCADGQYRLAGNFEALPPASPGTGIWLSRFVCSTAPTPTDQVMGVGSYIHTCALQSFTHLHPEDRLIGSLLHPALHEPVRLLESRIFQQVS